MNIAAWAIVGLIAGFIASRFVDRFSSSIVIDLLLGAIGGIAGGLIIRATNFQMSDNLFDPPSVFLAALVGVVAVVLYHMIRRSL
ncbi:MAG: GlsB/YeaQ/YmgE family stress response membrane protein [Acidobacteria bacterium]|nr:MAG: GlsB/YeaQ/YmgE family stress response membrane protein [Acidobacteriota bacterium]